MFQRALSNAKCMVQISSGKEQNLGRNALERKQMGLLSLAKTHRRQRLNVDHLEFIKLTASV